jgi:hypothetical protein
MLIYSIVLDHKIIKEVKILYLKYNKMRDLKI